MSAAVANADTIDVLTALVHDCADVLAASATGILVTGANGELDFLCASSHATAELELYEVQQATGPCVDAARTMMQVAAIGGPEIEDRWGEVGIAITAAGYRAATAFPLRWHGRGIGAMNVFYTDLDAAAHHDQSLGQAFADVAAVVILQSAELADDDIESGVARALQATTVIERAKGVLAFTHDITMAAAYDRMIRTAAERNVTITSTAAGIIEDAQRQS
jgi:hypothetical protein